MKSAYLFITINYQYCSSRYQFNKTPLCYNGHGPFLLRSSANFVIRVTQLSCVISIIKKLRLLLIMQLILSKFDCNFLMNAADNQLRSICKRVVRSSHLFNKVTSEIENVSCGCKYLNFSYFIIILSTYFNAYLSTQSVKVFRFIVNAFISLTHSLRKMISPRKEDQLYS